MRVWRFALALVGTGCHFGHGSSTEVVDQDEHSTEDAATSVRSCADLRGPSGVFAIDPDGAGDGAVFEVYCDQELDGGGWTLIASLVNGDAARNWATLESFEATTPFGAIATRESADFKSPAYGALAAGALLVVTDQYAFAFHELAGQTFPQLVAGHWPGDCSRTWVRETADFTQNLSAMQAKALGLILRGNDENAGRCFPAGDEATVLAFLAGDQQNNGLGNAASGSAWGQRDLSLPNLASFTPVACTGGYPCNAHNVKLPWSDPAAGTVHATRALVFVR